MRRAVLVVLVAVLCQQTLVSCHTLVRSPAASDLTQLKSLLERLEESLGAAAQEADSDPDYEGREAESERGQAGREWLLEEERSPEAVLADRGPAASEGQSRSSQRSRLQDLLLTARKRASGCFGARMDRIGNSSGLGCNSGRG